MSSEDARRVLESLKAIKPSQPAIGGGYGTPGGAIGSGISPLVASYNMPGMPYGDRVYGTALPRDPREFLSGMFSPLAPIQPVSVDQPQPGFERPQPRGFEYQPSWNMPIGVPGSEGLKLASFANLRSIADIYSVARACIKLRIQEILGLEWDIIPTKDAEKNMRGSDAKHKDFQQRRAKAMSFWRNPDPNYGSFESWLSAVLEDVLVIDALSLYLHPSKMRGKGLLGSDVAAVEVIAGETIRPLLDVSGGRPKPPNPAYQQFLFGVPRSDLMTVINNEDLPDGMTESMVAEYRGDQLMYLPYFRRSWTPYGYSNLEQALIPAMMGIQRQSWQLDTYSEGSVPAVFISAGDQNATPNQLRELQDALNAMAGDPAWKHKIIVLPGGSKIDPMKPQALADAFDEIMMTQMCMAYDVMPLELGISPKVSTTQSPGAANQMAKACYAEGTEVLTRAGWKLFEDVSTGDYGDEFATRNPKTGAFEWQHATAYHEYDHDGDVVDFTSRHGRQISPGLHLRVTPNHRMVTVEPVAKSKPVIYREYIREASSIEAQRVSLPITSVWDGSGPQSVAFGRYKWSATDFAALLGAYVAEGSLGRAGDYLIKIHQMPQSKGYEPYRELLTRMLGREPAYTGKWFYFACRELWELLDELGHAHEKYIPLEFKDWTIPCLRALLDHYLLGDGWLEGDRFWRAKTVSPRLADDLQEIAQKLGMSATITLQHPRDAVIKGRLIPAENCRDIYLVRFNESVTRRATVGRSHYTGKVRCVSVPNGVIYVRTNGSPVWCGNSEKVNQRKALRPLLKWLKASVFDFVMQKVCGQHDMQFMWEGLEEGVDEESQVGLLIQEISFGLRSIDEARIQRGEQPWGLPMTSDPVYATPNGLMPIGSIDPNTGMPAALQPEVAPGSALPGNTAPNGALAGTTPSGNPSSARTVKPGKPNRLPTASVPGPKAKPKPTNAAPSQKPVTGPRVSPSHTAQGSSTKREKVTKESVNYREGSNARHCGNCSMYADHTCTLVEGYIGPSMLCDEWDPRHDRADKGFDTRAALKELDLVRRQLRKDRSITDWEVKDLPQQVMAELRADLYSMDAAEVVMKARDSVYKLAKQRAGAGTADREAAIEHVQSRVATDLRSLCDSVENGKLSTADFLSRATEVMRAGIRAGLQAGAYAAVGQARTEKHTALRLRGKTWTNIVKDDDEQPDGYSNALDSGTPYGDYLDTMASQQADEQSGYLSGLLQDILAAFGIKDWLDSLTGRLNLYAAQVRSAYEQGYGTTYAAMNDPGSVVYTWYTTSGKPCKLCAAREGQQYTEDQLPGFPGQGGFGGQISGSEVGICEGGPNCKCYLSATTIPDGTGGGGFFKAARAAFSASLKAVLGKAQAEEITQHDHGYHTHPDETHHVYAYLARHYPSDVLGWVKAARWRGPVEVKLSDINMKRREGGARNPDKVRAIALGIEDGHKIDPIVLVKMPDKNKYQVADGWHRSLAIQQTGRKTAMAWIGEVDADSSFSAEAMGEASLNYQPKGLGNH